MSPYLPAEIWKRASPPNKYRRRDSCDVPTNGNPRAEYSGKFLDSAQPSIFRSSVAAESSWCRPPALCRTLCCSPFSVLLSRSIDTFLRFSPHVEYPETLVSGESFYGEDRIIFLIFVYTISRREGNYIHFHMFHKSIDNNVASTDTTQKWRRVSLPAIIRMRKLFLLPSRRKLRRKLSSYSKCVW